MSRRRPVRALGLLLCVAVAFSGFVANADAKRMSKAKKHAISKKLMRAVKHNPKVISKRWFLKQASLVSFSLPSTIRLTPAKDQNGNVISNDTTKNTAVLNLGPSLGSRTIGLTGSLHANINFNDAFDGGSLGDVKISLPPDTSALKTTGVALLTNSNARTSAATIAPEAELVNMIVDDTDIAAGNTLAITDGKSTISAGLTLPLSAGFDANFLTSAQNAKSPASSVTPAVPAYTNTVGPAGVYEYSAPYADGGVCGPPTAPLCHVVSLVFTGYDNGGLELSGIPFMPYLPAALGGGAMAATTPDWRRAKLANGDAATGVALHNEAPAVPAGPLTLNPIVASVRATKGVKDSDGMQGCGSFEGNGTSSSGGGTAGFGALGAGNDADFVSNLKGTTLDNSIGDINELGPGPFDGLGSPASTTPAEDVVLRTAPLSLRIAAPGTVDTPGDNSDNPGSAVGNAGYTASSLSLDVADGSAFHVGNKITVSDGFNQSLGAISAVSGNTLTLDTVLANGGSPTGLSPAKSYATGAVVSVNSDGVVKKLIGGSGGRANLFGAPVNGLAKGNSVDVTVNLATDINAIARQVDGQYPGPAGPNTANEKNGNISAYFNCRQAWTGNIRNYLNGIKLVGALRISPALTADGKVRIAKVALRTPSPVPAQLAACLMPYQLFMNANPNLLASDPGKPAPQLIGGTTFNPLAVLYGSGVPSYVNPANPLAGITQGSKNNSAPPTSRPCNSGSGPLDRDPFNVNPIGTTGPGPHAVNGVTDLSSILSKGAAVGVSGDISTKIQAEVLIGTH